MMLSPGSVLQQPCSGLPEPSMLGRWCGIESVPQQRHRCSRSSRRLCSCRPCHPWSLPSPPPPRHHTPSVHGWPSSWLAFTCHAWCAPLPPTEWYDAGKAYYEGANPFNVIPYPIPFNTLLATTFLLVGGGWGGRVGAGVPRGKAARPAIRSRLSRPGSRPHAAQECAAGGVCGAALVGGW